MVIYFFSNERLGIKKELITQSYLHLAYLVILSIGTSVSTLVNDTQVVVAIYVAICSYGNMYSQKLPYSISTQLWRIRDQEILI